MHTMVRNKKQFGISVGDETVNKVEKIVKDSEYLNTNRSEVIEVILRAFFKKYDNERDIEKVRGDIIEMRKK